MATYKENAVWKFVFPFLPSVEMKMKNFNIHQKFIHSW